MFVLYKPIMKAANTRKNKKRYNKTIKRSLDTLSEPISVWGKNQPLETFWRKLANGTQVVIIYKNGTHKYVRLPKNSDRAFNDFDTDPSVVAVLSSNSSQDAYEVYLYPKAKDQSVEYVIQHYKKFFKSMGPPSKDRPEGTPLMKKVLVPL